MVLCVQWALCMARRVKRALLWLVKVIVDGLVWVGYSPRAWRATNGTASSL
jgi:hypothetical protein